MKKVALVVMLLSASAFGAVTLTAPPSVDAVGTTYTVDLSLSGITADAALVCGFDMYANTANPAQFKVSRTYLADAITAANGGNPAVATISNTQLTASTPNFGGITDLVSMVPQGKILTVVFTPVAPLTAPVTINWSGLWVDGNTIDTGGQLAGVTVLTPEPISALLLGLGSLFFARRRRA